MKLVLASKNRKKLEELCTLLQKAEPAWEIVTSDAIGFSREIEETGHNFEENALLKAKAIASLGYFALGDDSGLCVDALNGAPGIYSARYAGEHGNDAKNNQKLLQDLAGVAACDRSATFVCAMACAAPDGAYFTVRGECPGKIAAAPAGNGGFGYDPLFIPNGFSRSFAQLTPEEKNAVSHRKKALDALMKLLLPFVASHT